MLRVRPTDELSGNNIPFVELFASKAGPAIPLDPAVGVSGRLYSVVHPRRGKAGCP